MAISALTVMLFIWQNFLLNIYFAAKKFLKANFYLNVSNVVRIIGLGIIYFGDMISIPSVMVVLMVLGNVTFMILVFIDKRSYLKEAFDAKVSRAEFRFKYTLTYFVASQFLNLGLRMDLFIISYFNLIITRPEVGFYAAAQKIVLTLLTTIISITQVLSPGFTQIKNQKQAREQLKNGFLYMLLPCAAYVGVVLTPSFFYELFFTSTFSQSAVLARLLSLPFILYALGSVPMLLLLYTVKKPKPLLIAYTAFVIIVTVGNYVFVPIYKLFTPPVVFLVAFAVSSAYISFEAWREYKKLPR
jgi:O-antigen/teichoic acid export membrane protein